MKKFLFLLLTCVLPAMQQTSAANLWQGETVVNWLDGHVVTIEASQFADMQVADILRLSFIANGQGTYPQVSLQNGNKKDLAGTPSKALMTGMTQMDFYASRIMLADIQQHGLIITGIGYTLTSVNIIEHSDASNYDHAVWIGSTVLPSDWSVVQTLPKSCFANILVGQILRLCYKDLHIGSEAILRTNNWNGVPGMEGYTQLSGNHLDIPINPEMCDVLKKEGCVVDGISFTLTAVEILNEDDLSKLQAEVPVVNDWMWFSPDLPTFRVNVTNPTTEDLDFEIVIRIADDLITSHEDYSFSESLPAGESIDCEYCIDADWKPGFYETTILVDGEVARTFVFGYDATEIVAAPDMQADFLDFWETAKTELAGIDGQYTLTEIPERSTDQRKVYLLEMKSVPDGTGEGIARAYYAEPTAAGTYPVVVQFCGYDGGGSLYIPYGDDNSQQIELVVSTRGQSINNRPPYTNQYGDWYSYGFGNRETWYYRGAFMDCLRALDFIETREKVQRQNIFATGSSQGGAFSIVCAALGDGRINAIAPAVPYLGDFPNYFKLVAWAGNFVNWQKLFLGLKDEVLYAGLSYFDTKNLATYITCPVLMNFSLQDHTCPPRTNWAAYNNLASEEKYFLTNPALGHTVGATWGTDVNSFFDAHLKTEVDGIRRISYKHQTDHAIYDLRGVRHNGTLSTLPHGIYIQQGRKIVR